MSPIARPLDGVRVIDFGQLTAGANTSAMLADLGADVIKIEAANRIDLFRYTATDREPGWWNRSPHFHFTNRNKRGIALDLKDPEGRKLALELLSQSDIVVENFRRGVLDGLGLGYAEVSALNPRVIYAAVTSQGEDGPNRLHRTYGSTLDALGGLAALTGYPEGAPTLSGVDVNYPDQVVSLIAVGFVLAALREARSTGHGALIDIPQREIVSFLVGEEIVAASADPDHEFPTQGNSAPGILLQDTFRGSDERWLALTLWDEAQAEKLRNLVGREGDLRPAIELWCEMRSSSAAVTELRGAGLSAMVVLNGKDLIDAPSSVGESLAWSPEGTLVKGMPYAFENLPFTVERAAPALGADTEQVLTDVLGLDTERIEALATSGVTNSDPLSA